MAHDKARVAALVSISPAEWHAQLAHMPATLLAATEGLFSVFLEDTAGDNNMQPWRLTAQARLEHINAEYRRRFGLIWSNPKNDTLNHTMHAIYKACN